MSDYKEKTHHLLPVQYGAGKVGWGHKITEDLNERDHLFLRSVEERKFEIEPSAYKTDPQLQALVDSYIKDTSKFVSLVPALKNKVEEQDIEDEIESVEYHILPDTTTTVCIIKLKNGWNSTGISACVDPSNFNQFVGEEWAYKDAFKKLWPLFGFNLKQKIYEASKV